MINKNKLIVTTSWDDGSVFDLKIVELLSKYGLKGTFYVPKSLHAHPLEEHDIVEIDKNFEIGSHTLSHADLTRMSLVDAKKEIEGSKLYLEELLGHNVCMFCYPDGRYNRNIIKIVSDAGFIAARTTKRGNFHLPPNLYEWQVTLGAYNGIKWRVLNGVWPAPPAKIKSMLDWEVQAKILFNKALKEGGVYHIWGHSIALERNLHWDKLNRVLNYISQRDGVQYMTNGEIFQS